MAAAVVSSRLIADNFNEQIVRLIGTFTDTQETAVLKADASGMAFAGASPRPAIRKVKYDITGPGVAQLLFDATANVIAASLSGKGEKVFPGGLSNNAGSGVTGDILLTTLGIPSGGAYDIELTLDKRVGFNIAPTVTAIEFTDEESGDYVTGETIQITLTFDRKVFLHPGALPTIIIDANGATTLVAKYVSGEGTNQLVFEYVVQSGDNAEATEFDVATDALAGSFRSSEPGHAVATDPAIPASDTSAFTVNPA